MPVHDTFRFARRSRRIDDFDDIVGRYRAGFEAAGRRQASQHVQHGRIDHKFRFRFSLDACHQFG